MSQFDYQAILDTYRDLQNQANQANEQRYQDILGAHQVTTDQVGETYGQVGNLLENIGQAEGEQIDIRGERDFAASEQDLITRGIGRTSIREGVRRGIGEDVDRSKRALAEQTSQLQAGVLQDRAGAEERLGNRATSIMEARTDKGPDVGQFAGLLQQAGQAQGTAAAAAKQINTGLSANARAGLDAFGAGSNFIRPASTSTTASSPGSPAFGLTGGTGGPSGNAYILRNEALQGVSGAGATGGASVTGSQAGFQGGGGQGILGGQAPTAGATAAPTQGTGTIAPTGGGAGYQASGGQITPTGGDAGAEGQEQRDSPFVIIQSKYGGAPVRWDTRRGPFPDIYSVVGPG